MTPEATEMEPRTRDRVPLNVKLTALALAVILLAAVAVAVFLTSGPGFFARYHGLERRYDTLQTSVHKDLACSQCHTGAQGPVVYRAGLIGDFYASLFSKPRDPLFTKMGKPTRDACLECHEYGWSIEASRTMVVPHPAHLRVSAEERECVTCHKWTAHEEAYQEKHKAMPFSGVCATYGCHTGFKKSDECATCHHTFNPDKEAWKKAHPKAVKTIGPNACLGTCHEAAQCRLCHTTGKTPVFTGLQAQSGLKAIEVLHVRSDWMQQHGTQALADKSKCLVCHVSEGECQDCHAQRPAFHGSPDTWLGTHKDLAKDKRRCLACHEEPWCNECHDQFKEMR